MRVPLEWLKEFVDIDVGEEKVAETLTMIGLEVEGTESLDGDVIFEVNVTPNRPDCLSIFGVAREISAAMKVPLKTAEFNITEEDSDDDFRIEILKPDLCHRYAGRVIKDIKMGQSPEWLKNRITRCGIRAINNIVDITNYVLLEFGHPLHAFDCDILKGKTIKVDIAGEDNEITTLDGIERKLPPDALLIWDAKNPVAIAGIMGGNDTEVTDHTKNVFLESAYFEQGSIRRTSKTLGLKSESSYRFERGADKESLIKALDRAASLMQQIAGGKVYKRIDNYPNKFVPCNIDIRYDKVNRLLGANISKAEMLDIIKRLSLNTEGGNVSFRVRPPAFRLDLKTDIDIIEEIARIYGYNNMPTTIPKASILPGNSDRKRSVILRIKDIVRRAGFDEAINYSFMNETDLDLLGIPLEDRRRRAIPIKNPLRKEESLLRTTLIPSLIGDLTYNFSRGIKNIKIFEMARIFEDIGRPLPIEISKLGGIYFRERSPVLWKDDTNSFYLVKGIIESILDELHVNSNSFSLTNEPFLHPGLSCDIRISGISIGFIGLLSPLVVERLDLKVSKPEVIVFEIDIDKMASMIPVSLEYSPIPKFPYIERDVAIIVDDKLNAIDIENLIRAYPSDLIEEVTIFDFYKGKNIPVGKKSLAFNIRYRSRYKTLIEAEVEDVHQGIVKYLISETGGEPRA
jgi:phenylalanyl-tRNA synthetase beta chain